MISHGFPHDFDSRSRRVWRHVEPDRRQATARSGRSRIGGRTTRIHQKAAPFWSKWWWIINGLLMLMVIQKGLLMDF